MIKYEEELVGERSSHQFAHVEGKTVQTSTQLIIPPMELIIPGCVEESLHINLELQKDFLVTLTKINKHLMMHMLMEFQLHLATHEIIFGHLLQHEQDKIIVLVYSSNKCCTSLCR